MRNKRFALCRILAEPAGRAEACAICKFALCLYKVCTRMMILINCVQSEDCANIVDCVFCTHERDLAMHVVNFYFFPGLAPMREKMVAVRVSVRQSPNA